MSQQLLAYCGIDCSACPAYIATQANDIDRLTALAQEWFERNAGVAAPTQQDLRAGD